MREVEDMIRRAALGTFTVLIRGESGTGKDVAARAIHKASARREAPFVRVQCAAFPETLIESELFGYEKAAFTGAASRRPGRVELAEGGTLFLDEIGDIKPVIQVKLLRLLQEKEFERLGGTQTLKSSARFIAATHQPLEEMIKKGLFREDLFYRLNVLSIWIPPLRERAEDIQALALRFCADAGAANGREGMEISPQALALLRHQPWPGNVRQLQNFIERLVVMSDGAGLAASDVERELARQAPLAGVSDSGRYEREAILPPSAASPSSASATSTADGGSLEGSRREAERQAILTALERAGNNRSLAARLLLISRRSLYNKLAEHGLL
jgi:two-component system response regulator AtoC